MADYQNELEAYEQQMPYNLEAEQSVLGAILIDPSNHGAVSGISGRVFCSLFPY